ncbi:MAG: hypothetical protein RIS25_1187 [Actinomycetota bacterium]|jgi:hypothetical protein
MGKPRIDDHTGLEHVRAALGTEPRRDDIAGAVRYLLQLLSDAAPGNSVEVRVPPFGAVHCVDGPSHSRGTPPNVVECDPVGWIHLATGSRSWSEAVAAGQLRASGIRSDLSELLPVLSVG